MLLDYNRCCLSATYFLIKVVAWQIIKINATRRFFKKLIAKAI